MLIKYKSFSKGKIKEGTKIEYDKFTGLNELKKRHDNKETKKEVKLMCNSFLKKEISPKEFIEWAEKIYDLLDLEDSSKVWNTKTLGMIKFNLSCYEEKWKKIK